MIRKTIIIIGVTFFLLFFKEASTTSNSIQEDEITKYAFKKINAVNNEFKETHFLRLAELSIKLGRTSEAIRIFNVLSDDYSKYSIVFNLLNCNKLPNGDIKNIMSLGGKIEYEPYKTDILIQQIMYYLREKDKKNSQFLLNKLKKIDNQLKIESCPLLFELANRLYKSGLTKEAGTIMKVIDDYENLPEAAIFSSMIDILKNHELFEEIDKYKLISKIETIISNCKYDQDKVKYAVEFCLALTYIQEYERAQKYLEKTFSFCTGASDIFGRIRRLRVLLKKVDNIFVMNMLIQIKDFEKILIENIDFSNEEINPAYSKDVIGYLVKKGKFKKAEKISLRLDKQFRTPESSVFYLDYFYFFTAKEYLRVRETRIKALDFVKKIKNHSRLRLKLLLEYADVLDPTEDEEEFLKIIDQILKTEIKNKWERDEFLGDISMLCLRKGFTKKALDIIEKVEYNPTKSILIYEVAQILIRQYNSDLAKNLLGNYQPEPFSRAYIMSKIAARLLIDSKFQQSNEMFKKAIDILLTSDIGDLEVIFNDYYYAKIKGKIIKTRAWKKMNLVE
jgi:hypothetical protein